MDYKTLVQNYLKKEVLRNRDANIEENSDLVSEGILDSLGILQIVAYIESNLNIQIPDEDVVYENFHSLGSIASYLETNSNT
jgi:acyl carrier protein